MDEKVMRKFLISYVAAEQPNSTSYAFGHTTLLVDGSLTADVIQDAARQIADTRGVQCVVILNVVPLEG